MSALKLLATAVALTLLISVPCSAACGDYNGDGASSIADAVYGMEYLFTGGPAPVNMNETDIDDHAGFTLNDIDFLVNVCPWGECDLDCNPALPVLEAPTDTNFQVIYSQYMWRQVTKFAIKVSMKSKYPTRTLVLPLRLRIAGQVPQIDSVQFPVPNSDYTTVANAKSFDADSGYVLLGSLAHSGNTIGTRATIAMIYVTMPASTDDRLIEMQYVNLTPVNAPTPDSSIVPFLSDWNWNIVSPQLRADCCNLCGDSDRNGFVSVADVLKYICYIFGGCGGGKADASVFCNAQLDANNSGGASISDAIFLINYIFAGGPKPMCPFERP